jgi:hypothetical protein
MKQILTITFVIGIGGLCGGCAFLPEGVNQAKIINDVVASPAALVAIVAAGLAFLSGVLGPLVQFCVGRKQAAASQESADAAMLTAKTTGAREIAKLRMVWMETLRNKLSEYHSILMNFEDDDREVTPEMKTAEDRKLSELGTHLDLLLDRTEPLQQTLWDISDRIYKTHDQSARVALDVPLIEAGRAVLKAEWEKVQIEMREGSFQSSRS